MFMFETLKFIPAKVWVIDGELLGILAFGIGGLGWLLIPFIDKTEEGTVRSRTVKIGGLFVVAFIVIMTALGYLL